MNMPLNTNRSTDPLVQALQEEARSIEEALAKDPRHKRLAIIRHTLDELAKLAAFGGKTLFDVPERSTSAARMATSVGQSAQFALEDAGRPLPLSPLLNSLAKYGKVPGGAKPAWNLSNTLSGDERFISVEYRGEKCWWLMGKPVPPE